MAEEFKGLSQDQINKIDQYKTDTAEVYESYKKLNAELKKAGQEQDKLTTSQFQGKNIAADLAQLQKEAVTKTNSLAKLETERSKQIARAAALDARRVTLLGKAAIANTELKVLYLKQAENLSNSADHAKAIAKAITEIKDDAAELNNSSSFFTGLSKIIGDIPGLRKLSGPFDAAAKASKETVLNNSKLAKGVGKKSPFGAGMSAMFQSAKGALKALTSMGGIVLGLGMLIKFVVDLFIQSNKQAVDLARSMGSSVEQADALRGQFAEIRRETNLTRNNTKYLIEAQGQLNDEFGATFRASDEILSNQTFLTKRLKLNASEASKLNIRMSATGEDAEKSAQGILDMSNSFKQANGFGMTFKSIMSSVANASSEISGYFGFSNKAIAAGVVQVRRFGVSLGQAQNIASGLLDFEQSISSELEAEVLTGKQFNLERARAMAATGDIAGATSDVLSQMQSLTAEQRKSPIIMQAVAKATGLSVDELQKAYIITGNNKSAAKEYYRVLKEGSEDEINSFKTRSNLDKQTMKDIEKRKTLEEDFAEAMTDMKSTFVDFVNGGTLQSLASGLKTAANFVANIAGEDEKMPERYKNKEVTDEQLATANLSRKAYEDLVKTASLQKGAFGITSDYALATNSGIQESRNKVNQISANDFTIKTHPKDTLKMEGGTKFGDETNTLLKSLLGEMRKSTVLKLDSNALVQKAIETTYK